MDWTHGFLWIAIAANWICVGVNVWNLRQLRQARMAAETNIELARRVSAKAEEFMAQMMEDSTTMRDSPPLQ